MHIAIDARIINSSTGRYVERLLHFLQKVDTYNRYTVLVREKDVHFWKPTQPNFAVMVAEFENFSFREQFGFKKFLDELAPDLVHFCMPQQPILYSGPSVTTFHDLIQLKFPDKTKNQLIYGIKRIVATYAYKSSLHKNKFIITPTEYTKQELLDFSGISPDKIIVTNEAADVVENTPQPLELPFTDFIMYVGRQVTHKNITRLLDAHALLKKHHPQLGLVLAGKKGQESVELEKYISQKGYSDIFFTDYIDNNQLVWLYQNTQAYVFPSLYEGFGLPGLEAMGCGAAVVSSNATCLPEVYGDAALYFNPLDTTDMANKIHLVLSDEKLRKELSVRGAALLQKYSWEKMAHETLKVYERAITA